MFRGKTINKETMQLNTEWSYGDFGIVAGMPILVDEQTSECQPVIMLQKKDNKGNWNSVDMKRIKNIVIELWGDDI